jgi:hypothetical protein
MPPGPPQRQAQDKLGALKPFEGGLLRWLAQGASVQIKGSIISNLKLKHRETVQQLKSTPFTPKTVQQCLLDRERECQAQWHRTII